MLTNRCLLIIVGAFATASCDRGPDTSQNQQGTAQPGPSFSTANPQPLQLTVVSKPIANGAHIEGRTNLPDGTELMLTVERPPVVGDAKAIVSTGRFAMDILPKDGAPVPSGNYEVEVSTPLGDLQPTQVKEQLGSDYEALTGPLLVKSSVSGGRIIEYTSKVHIGGAPDPKADQAARRQAYVEHEAYSEKACSSNPDAVERISGIPMSPSARKKSVQRCLRMMADSREELVREGLLQH